MNAGNTKRAWNGVLTMLLAGCAATAIAVPVGDDLEGPTNETTTEFTSDGPDGQDGWVIGSPDNPIPISLNEEAGPWLKDLTESPEAEIGDSFMLWESIRMTGNSPWNIWREDFFTEGWEWTSGQIYDGDGNLIADGLINEDANSIDFFFDPTGVQELFIVKEMTWRGTASTDPWVDDVIQVVERPDFEEPVIPEPASLALLGLGTSMVAAVRRRRK